MGCVVSFPVKTRLVLFKAFERLQAEGVNFHLIVFGSGYEGVWKKRCAGNPQIHIIGERKNVADYMAMADLLVFPFDYEGLPLSLLEAMSLGIVPICTSVGGIVDVIEDGANGYMTSLFEDDEFYHKIKLALNEKGKLNKDYIRSVYENNFSMKVCTKKYHILYENHSLFNR